VPEEEDNDLMEVEYDSDDAKIDIDELGTVVDMTLEGFTPAEDDTDGISRLLRQSMVGLEDAACDAEEPEKAWLGLARLVVDQNYLGSVIKQTLDATEAMEEEEDELEGLEDVESDFVHGVTTIVNLSKAKNSEAAIILDNIRSQLLKKCSSSSISEGDKELFKDALKSDATDHTGFLINERLYDYPMDISIPAFKSLKTEVEAAKQIELDVDFKKVILITKLLKIKEKSNKKNRAVAAATVKEVYENEEDETLAERCLASFEYCVQNEKGVGQKKGVQRYRRVMLLDYSDLLVCLGDL